MGGGGGRERKRDSDRERQRQRETETGRERRERQTDRERQRQRHTHRDCSFILKDKGFRQSMSYDLSFLTNNNNNKTATTKTEGGGGGCETETVCVEGGGRGRVSTIPMVSITPRRGYLPLTSTTRWVALPVLSPISPTDCDETCSPSDVITTLSDAHYSLQTMLPRSILGE